MGTSGAAEVIYKGKSLGFAYFGHDGFYLFSLVMDMLLDTIEKEGFEAVKRALDAYAEGITTNLSCSIEIDSDGSYKDQCDMFGVIDITEKISILARIREWVLSQLLTEPTFKGESDFLSWATVQLARPHLWLEMYEQSVCANLKPAIHTVFPCATNDTVERLNASLCSIPSLI